jgi:hypothetical protein
MIENCSLLIAKCKLVEPGASGKKYAVRNGADHSGLARFSADYCGSAWAAMDKWIDAFMALLLGGPGNVGGGESGGLEVLQCYTPGRSG